MKVREDVEKRMFCNGAWWRRFYLSNPHHWFPYTYMLLYPYPTGMRNWISSPSWSSSDIPALSLYPQWIICFLMQKERNRGYEIWKENRELDWVWHILTCSLSKWNGFRICVFIYIKQSNKVISNIRGRV